MILKVKLWKWSSTSNLNVLMPCPSVTYMELYLLKDTVMERIGRELT